MRANISTEARDTTRAFSKISTGKYLRIGDQISKDQFTYLICTRQNVTDQKAEKYLLLKIPARKYISSLYNTNLAGKYHFEFDAIQYTLYTSSNEAIITLRT